MSKNYYDISLVYANGGEVPNAWVNLYCHGSAGNTGEVRCEYGRARVDTVGFGPADVHVRTKKGSAKVGRVSGPGSHRVVVPDNI